jgi:hypothetical protein
MRKADGWSSSNRGRMSGRGVDEWLPELLDVLPKKQGDIVASGIRDIGLSRIRDLDFTRTNPLQRVVSKARGVLGTEILIGGK